MTKLNQIKQIYDAHLRHMPKIPDRMFTEQDLLEAKEKAYEKGLNVGKDEIDLKKLQQQQMMNTQMIQGLKESIEFYLAEQTKLQSKLSNLILNLSICLFKKVFPTYDHQYGINEIKTFIEAQLQELIHVPELTIHVCAEHVDVMQGYIKELMVEHQLSINVSVKASDDLTGSDCRIHWDNGYLEKKLQNILDALSRAESELPKDKPMYKE